MLNAPVGLADADFFVLKFVCEAFLKNKGTETIPTESIIDAAKLAGLPQQEIEDAAQALGENTLLDAQSFFDEKTYPAQLHPTDAGFDLFYRATIPNYEDIIQEVGLSVLNLKYGQGELSDIAAAVKQPEMLVDHILKLLEGQGFNKESPPRAAGYFNLSVTFLSSVSAW